MGGLLSLCQGAWEIKTLSVALETELFSRISRGAGTIDKISQESGIDLRMLTMLTNACIGIGLLTETKGVLKNSRDAELYLVKQKKSYIGDFILLVGEEYYDVWRSLKEVVMTGRPVRDDRMVRLTKPGYAEGYIKAMQQISLPAAQGLARFMPLGKKKLLEVGGGAGAFSAVLSGKGLESTIYDSPFACDIVDRYIREKAVKHVSTLAGDFEKGAIPTGYDVVMLTHVLHGLAPEKCEALLTRIHESLPKGGVVIVNDFLLEKSGASPVFSSLLTMNAFMLSNGGSLHTAEQMKEWITNAGFAEANAIKTSELIISLIGKRVV
jgi:2-polyprenyl-3-methyl-5-hydroxy-6-metoxy-1,4-benzoquinol methylase